MTLAESYACYAVVAIDMPHRLWTGPPGFWDVP